MIIAYTILSIINFGAKEGFYVSIMTWSFFVLCTPVASAGILLDLPIKIFTGIKMLYSEIAVWIIAIIINIITMMFHPEVYSTTIILSIFHKILSNMFPYGIIIVFAAIGTFLSIVFGDEIIDVAYEQKKTRLHHQRHKHKHYFVVLIFLFILILIIFDFLLNSLGVSIPLF
ncbi:MAG: hypothetical protein ABH828_05495 [archaeon]